MTGPERLVDAAQAEGADLLTEVVEGGHSATIQAAIDVVSNGLAAAQVHATLALAAATAAGQATAYDGDEGHARSRGWAGVA